MPQTSRIWPRHLLFFIGQQDHWTLGHLDREKGVLYHYNSLPEIRVKLDVLQSWIVTEGDVPTVEIVQPVSSTAMI